METLGYIAITMGIGIMPLALILGHQLGNEHRRKKVSCK